MHKPAHYRERAKFLNKMAQEAPTQALRDSYASMALQWEELAEKAEKGVAEKGQPKDSPKADDGNRA